MQIKKLLAIDTSTENFSICLYDNGKFTQQNILGDAKSSSFVLQMIDKITDLKNLDGLIYAKGPGAFTGVRVGIGVVCGLSLAKNIPTLGFSTLEAMEFGAQNKFNTDKIICALDARMGEIYMRLDTKNSLIKPKDLTLKTEFKDYIGIGTGFQTYGNFANCGSIDTNFYPQAINLIKLALNSLDKNLNQLSFDLPRPLYLRNNIAKKSTKINL